MDAGSRWWPALVALVTVVLAESIRVLFPLLYDVREDRGAGVAVLWALGVFVALPLLAWPARATLGAPRALRANLLILAATRLAIQFVHPIPLVLAGVAVGAGLVALALAIEASRRAGAGPMLAVALFGGLAADTALRGAFVAWGPAWQGGATAVTLGVLLGAALVVGAVRVGPPGRVGEGDGATFTAALLGPFLVLQLLFLQNPGFAGSETGLGVAGAIALLLVGDALAIAGAAAVATRPTAWLRGVAALLFVVTITAVAHLDGAAVGVALVVASGAAGAVLVCVVGARTAPAAPAWRGDVALALGWALFVGIAFAYQIDIDAPLPVPRAAWPIAAAVLVAAAATRSVRPSPAPRWMVAVPAAGLLVPVALGLAAPAAPSSPPAQPMPDDGYRLLDWNLHTAVNGDGQVDLGTIAELIESQDPDVVVLQEVGRGWPIAGANDQAEWLSRRLDMEYAWASAADDQFGNVILSRFGLMNAETLALPYGEGPQHRSALRALVDTGGGDLVQVIDVHLQNGDVPATREDQIAAILAAWPHDPGTVIAGDLNMQPTEDNVRLFTEAGFASAQDDPAIGDPDGTTARDPYFPGDRVDWIWVTPAVTFTDFAIVDSAASDHLPLVVVSPAAG